MSYGVALEWGGGTEVQICQWCGIHGDIVYYAITDSLKTDRGVRWGKSIDEVECDGAKVLGLVEF